MIPRIENYNHCVWPRCNPVASWGRRKRKMTFTNDEELGVLTQMGEALCILFCYNRFHAGCSSGLCRRVIH